MKRIFSILFAVVLVVSFSLIPSALVGANPGPGLAALWHFDKGSGPTASDSSGNGNTGALRNGASWTTSGKFGNALSFDGINDYVEVPHSPSLDITSQITVEGWIKLSSFAQQSTIAGKWRDIGPASLRGYLLTVGTDGKPRFYISTNGSDYPKAEGTALSLNTWYHLAGTYDGTNIKLYVNGALVATQAQTGAIFSNTEPLLIGANDGWGGSARKFTNGLIDEVRIWDVAMTPGPVTVPLCAGKNTNVGTVTVWNDSTNLYVKYETTGGWEMTETHLAVVDDDGDFPTTKTGNPIPGQFPDSMNHAPAVTMYTYSVPLPSGTPLYIATHAKVVKATELVVNGGFETPIVSGAWAVFASDTPGLAWTVEPTTPPWDGPPAVPGLELQRGHAGWLPDSGSQLAELDAYDPVRIYQNLPACPSGLYTLRYAWSPRPGVAENIVEVWWDGSVLTTHSSPGGGNTIWTSETHYLTSPSTGTVTLEFRETGTDDQLGMFLDSVSVVCVQEETAWGDGCEGTRFTERGNWATYFEYHVQ